MKKESKTPSIHWLKHLKNSSFNLDNNFKDLMQHQKSFIFMTLFRPINKD